MKTSRFQGIYYAIISVRLPANSKREIWIWQQLILCNNLNFVWFERSLHFQEWWIVEKYWRWSPWNWSIIKNDSIIWRPFQVYFLFSHVTCNFWRLNLEYEVLKIFIFWVLLLRIALLWLWIWVILLAIIIAFITLINLGQSLINFDPTLILRLIFLSFSTHSTTLSVWL